MGHLRGVTLISRLEEPQREGIKMEMKEQGNVEKEVKSSCKTKGGDGACGVAVYGLGIIGAAIYYISAATGFWPGVVGFLKALVWPVFLVYEVLKFIGA